MSKGNEEKQQTGGYSIYSSLLMMLNFMVS